MSVVRMKPRLEYDSNGYNRVGWEARGWGLVGNGHGFWNMVDSLVLRHSQ